MLQSGLEPAAEHLGPLLVALNVVRDELLAPLEPLIQSGEIFEEIRIEFALDERREVGEEDDVGQGNGLRLGNVPIDKDNKIIGRRGWSKGQRARLLT